MTCHCHDPLVFGHLTCRGETQGWNQPPLQHRDAYGNTYHSVESFTTTNSHINAARITAGSITGREAGHVIYDETIRITSFSTQTAQPPQALRNATVTEWNWLEAPEAARYWANTRITDEPCA